MMQPVDALERLRAAEFRAVGSNQTAKAIGKGRAQLVYVAKDADRRVVEAVLTAARTRGLDIIEIASMRDLGRACGIAVGASAAAVLATESNEISASEVKKSSSV
jgi:large subunit ribosomal protein L7A